MPVHIDEIVIQVEVGNAAGAPASPPPATDRQTLINECVERVLEILREREEP